SAMALPSTAPPPIAAATSRGDGRAEFCVGVIPAVAGMTAPIAAATIRGDGRADRVIVIPAFAGMTVL
ncbi:MAG: hypothetical protein AB1918_14020, partial [Pseudomonadota bacterium]